MAETDTLRTISLPQPRFSDYDIGVRHEPSPDDEMYGTVSLLVVETPWDAEKPRLFSTVLLDRDQARRLARLLLASLDELDAAESRLNPELHARLTATEHPTGVSD